VSALVQSKDFYADTEAKKVGKGFFQRVENVIKSALNKRQKFDGKENDHIKSKKMNLSEIFSQDFDEDLIISHFEEAIVRKTDDPIEIFSQNLTDKIQYKIYYEGGQISFQLLNEEKKPAELIFAKTDQGWNMYHRLVQSQELGISGTTFLKQAEKFFEILKKNKKIKEEKIGFEAGQVDVIEWGIKNGYDFATEEDRKKFEKVKNGDAGFVTGVDLVDPSDKIEKKNFIVSREKYDAWDKNTNIHYQNLSERFVLVKKIPVEKIVQMPQTQRSEKLAA
jgi:hypothetical protein